MFPQFQFVPVPRRVFWSMRRGLHCFLAGSILVCPLAARAQDAPPGAIGRVEGRDISCENTTPANGPTSTVGPSLAVSNGTVVTVHSGQALMTLFAGGQVDICGPAKLTVLLSGDSITLALDFGRVRVELPGKTALRVFTPTIIGTPLDIAGGSRDVTVGLSLDDSLCVVATSGAIQLEHQFTGEKLIVPQAGEFFLNAGRLLPVAGTPGSCQCVRAGPIPWQSRQLPSPRRSPIFNTADWRNRTKRIRSLRRQNKMRPARRPLQIRCTQPFFHRSVSLPARPPGRPIRPRTWSF